MVVTVRDRMLAAGVSPQDFDAAAYGQDRGLG
jgi:hypothetical protein